MYKQLIIALLLITGFYGSGLATEIDVRPGKTTDTIKAKGWLIEFDDEMMTDNKNIIIRQDELPSKKTGESSNIEMIIGGQGEDGVAKRGTLQIID